MKKQSMTKQELKNQLLALRDEKAKLALKLDDIVIASLNEGELTKLIEYNKRDITNIKQQLENTAKFIEGYKSILSF